MPLLSNIENEYAGLIKDDSLSPGLIAIRDKVMQEQRISDEDALLLFESAPLSFLSVLADTVRTRLNGNKTFFNRNFHIEPTNVCIYDCKFCSYSRLIKHRGEGWEYTMEDMLNIVKSYDGKPVTEVHIVGGVMPQYDLDFYCTLFRKIKEHRPDLHVKALTPVEYHYIFKKAKVTYEEGMKRILESGVDSIPGGGAEIFHPEIREQIAADKCNADQWLRIHEIWHELGKKSNATILYGHIEKYTHRVDHMRRLRELQDRTGGFQTFIPLKFRNKDNQMSHLEESTVIEDLKNYAVSRIYLDNFPHVKAYWPMLGRSMAQVAMSFGVDDLDGTIDDTTKIYSMAGAEEQKPAMSTYDLVTLIKNAGRTPIERDTLYHELKDWSDHSFDEDTVYRGYVELPILN
ncbi:MAG: aminofutalosine synthase MqnE [Saprospiraceae bacterium]|uniref:Aminodeoxyfutalosine synthase n=1 Tax=Candidatus Opimibacter skivensis TaxID=2982028 RepID=A0A9D7SVU1_9BACT|nr:aminofutalosine synthase MqnE [Candidatus Opimibacter skivensis]